MPPAVVKGSSSRWMRVLAALLTSNLFLLASCTGGFYIATAVTGAIADRSEQIPFEEENPPRHFFAIIVTPAGAPASVALDYKLVQNPERDLAEFRVKHPGYGFLPPSDKGHISRPDQDSYVDYRVVKRESATALVKTHYHHFPMIFSLDIRATYEATESEIRLISYRVGSDTASGVVAGPALGCSLALLGEVLKRRVGIPLDENPEAKSRAHARLLARRRKVAGALSLIGLAFGVLVVVAGLWPLLAISIALTLPSGLMWIILKLRE